MIMKHKENLLNIVFQLGKWQFVMTIVIRHMYTRVAVESSIDN